MTRFLVIRDGQVINFCVPSFLHSFNCAFSILLRHPTWWGSTGYVVVINYFQAKDLKANQYPFEPFFFLSVN